MPCDAHGYRNRSLNLLIILPPENMPDVCYSPENGNTREKTAAMNQLWREAAPVFPWITLLELTGFATLDDLSDPAHFYAGFLQKIAERMDAWVNAIKHEAPLATTHDVIPA